MCFCFPSNTDYRCGICNNSDLCFETVRNRCEFAIRAQSQLSRTSLSVNCWLQTEFNKFIASSVNVLSGKRSTFLLPKILLKSPSCAGVFVSLWRSQGRNFVCNVNGQKQSHFLTDRKETPVLRLCILQPYVPLRFVRVQTCLEENCDVSALIRLQTKLLFKFFNIFRQFP